MDDGSNDHRKGELTSGWQNSPEVSACHLQALTSSTSGEHVNIGDKQSYSCWVRAARAPGY